MGISMRFKFVLAGSKQQYDYFLSHTDHDPEVKLVYVHTWMTMAGLKIESQEDIIVTGNFWRRKEASRLYEYAVSRIKGKE
jgi:hypothetical protein